MSSSVLSEVLPLGPHLPRPDPSPRFVHPVPIVTKIRAVGVPSTSSTKYVPGTNCSSGVPNSARGGVVRGTVTVGDGWSAGAPSSPLRVTTRTMATTAAAARSPATRTRTGPLRRGSVGTGVSRSIMVSWSANATRDRVSRTGTRSRTRDHVSGTDTSSSTLNRSATTESKSSRMLGLHDRVAQRAVGPMQLHPHGARTGPEQLTDLRGRVATDVAQRDTGPLLRGEVG